MTTSRNALGLIAVLAFACGGKTVGDGVDGGGASTSGGVSSSGGDAGTTTRPDGGTTTTDAGVVVTHPDGGSGSGGVITCQPGDGSGSGGNGSCEVQMSETCTDGNSYSVDCSCPQATCFCSQDGPNGGSSGGGIVFSGCPICPGLSSAWDICGFPH